AAPTRPERPRAAQRWRPRSESCRQTISPVWPPPSSRSAPTPSSPGARSRSLCWPTSSQTSSHLAGSRLLWTSAVAISRPEPRRRLKLPRNLPGTRQLQPYSRVDAPYFRSPGFYVRVGGLAIVVTAGLSLLLLRAWSIQVLHGKQYARAAHTQALRTVDLLGARGAIVDARGQLVAGTTGHVVIEADAASLGSRDAHGRWSPSPAGVRALRRLGAMTG